MKRLYYSISQVSELLDIAQPTLRYWENQFTQLNPKRNEKGTRFYTQEDIDIIKQIIFLRNNEKLKLTGIQHQLDHNKTEIEKKQEIILRLQKIRAHLIGIRNQISLHKNN